MSRIQARAFSKRWETMLKEYRITPPLHMTDFVRPHGKHIGMHREMKLSLFSEVARLTNAHKVFSISVTISQTEFKKHLSRDVQGSLIGPYAFAFFSVLLVSRSLANAHNHDTKTAYFVDSGTSHSDQVRSAFEVVKALETEKRHIGALTFGSDDSRPTLQAADVVAWSARRRDAGNLSGEFEPLHEILSENRPGHGHVNLPPGGIKMLADPINAWISKRTPMPKLADIIRP